MPSGISVIFIFSSTTTMNEMKKKTEMPNEAGKVQKFHRFIGIVCCISANTRSSSDGFNMS